MCLFRSIFYTQQGLRQPYVEPMMLAVIVLCDKLKTFHWDYMICFENVCQDCRWISMTQNVETH